MCECENVEMKKISAPTVPAAQECDATGAKQNYKSRAHKNKNSKT